MFYGRWDWTIDDKWRLGIPADLKETVGKRVALYEGGRNCVVLEPLPDNIFLRFLRKSVVGFSRRGLASLEVYIVEVQVGKNPCKRVLIPE